MKIMKTWIALAIVAILGLASTAQADDKKESPKKKGARGGIGALVNQLDLTKEQKEKIQTFQRESREKFAELRKLPQDQRRAKMQEHRKALEAKLKEILTEEQQTKLKELQRANRAASKGKKPEKK